MRILNVGASAHDAGDSVSRGLASRLVERLAAGLPQVEVVTRDVSQAIAPVDAAFAAATNTPESERTEAMRERLGESDALVQELEATDVLVVSTPIYNFGVPSTLKAWVDAVARVRRTFHYTPDGPEGLLADRKVFLIVTSGGTEIEGEVDFATPWLRHMLGFLGLHDVEVIAAAGLMRGGEEAVAAAYAEADARAERFIAQRLERAA